MPGPVSPGSEHVGCGIYDPPPPDTARCMDRRFITNGSISFWTIQSLVADMSTRVSSSWFFRSERVNVPASVSRVHPKTSLTQVQSPYPARRLLRLTKSLESIGRDGKSHFRAQTVPSNTRCCQSGPTCTTYIKSSIYQSIRTRLSLVPGGG